MTNTIALIANQTNIVNKDPASRECYCGYQTNIANKVSPSMSVKDAYRIMKLTSLTSQVCLRKQSEFRLSLAASLIVVSIFT